jgi:hypothetical protein
MFFQTKNCCFLEKETYGFLDTSKMQFFSKQATDFLVENLVFLRIMFLQKAHVFPEKLLFSDKNKNFPNKECCFSANIKFSLKKHSCF